MSDEKQTPEVSIPESHIPILESAIYAQVSTVRHKDGYISTNPMSFDWDGEYLRLSTLKERVKYRNLLNNPQITICIVDPKDMTRYVEIRGVGELTDDPEGTLNRKMFRRLMGKEFDLDPPGAERVIIRVIPHQVSTPLLYGGKLSRDKIS